MNAAAAVDHLRDREVGGDAAQRVGVFGGEACATANVRDHVAYPVALAERGFGGRQLLDEFCARSGLRFQVAAESNSFELLRSLVGLSDLISFQISIGAPGRNNRLGLVTRVIDDRDVPRANLVLGQLRGRNLPVPTAVFADQLARSLDAARNKADA